MSLAVVIPLFNHARYIGEALRSVLAQSHAPDRVIVIDEGKILFDQTLEAISQKLSFRLSFDDEESAQALYKESSLKGNALILPNTNGEDSRPDLEMLYKAVTLDGERINAIFRI